MPNRVRALLKERGIKIKDIASITGYTHDSLMKINRGDTGLTHESIERLASAIKCYPSELLPLDWQKPGEINEEALIKATNAAMMIFKYTPLEPEHLSHIIISEYKDIIHQRLNTKDSNVNIS